MSDLKLFSIKYVAVRTGLKPHLIRMWERRYGVVNPCRTVANHRLYCGDDIRRLDLLKQVVAAGHRISNVCMLSNEQLVQLLATKPLPEKYPDPSENTGHDFLAQCIKVVEDLDAEGFQETLLRAAMQLSRPLLVETVIVPLFRWVDEGWAFGKLKLIHEQLASQYIRWLLLDLLRSGHLSQKPPSIVFATPFGQRHELGALSAALAAGDAGWRPIYIGTGLPAEELVAAVNQLQAQALALGVACRDTTGRLYTEMIRLRKHLGAYMPIFIGGGSAHVFLEENDTLNIQPIDSLHTFRRLLEKMRNEPLHTKER